MDRIADLRSDYEFLGSILLLMGSREGSAAAAIVRERRLISAELERLEATGEVALVDQLAEWRSQSGDRRPPVRRRESG